tara:strand:+ start:43044 stop:43628 length:585 start_codon:yes stop_codon:yes gene_type:complete
LPKTKLTAWKALYKSTEHLINEIGGGVMTYGVKAIANLLIDTAKEKGSHLDQMKLQKLVYIAHGWHLAIEGEPLFKEEIQAWQYGPVIPTLYNEFRNCGRGAITDYATDIEVSTDDLNYSFVAPQVKPEDRNVKELVDKIWDVYGGYTGPQLSNLTHMPGTPWDSVYKACPKSPIPNDLIREHFVELSQARNAR